MRLKKNKTAPIKKYAIGGLIGGVAQAGLGVGQAIYGGIQARKAGREMDRLLAGAPKLELPSAYQEYAQKAMDQATLRAQTEAINRRLATSTQALSQAGGRALLGGLQSQVTAANEAEIQAQDAQRQREMQGLQVLGGAQQQLAGMKESRFQMQYGEAQGAQQAALQNIGAGLGAIATGAITAGTSYEKDMFNSKSSSKGSDNDGSQYNWQRVGKKGMKTQGEFSHEKNPLYLVDKNGQVTGEATGGEYIVNPEQAKKISKESKFFRNLLKQKRFK